MRLWMVKPEYMCRKHLFGEHLETHMFIGSIKKGTSLKGYIENGLVDTSRIKRRHDALAKEIVDRGFTHKSPLEYEDTLKVGSVNVETSMNVLRSRCDLCNRRMKKRGA